MFTENSVSARPQRWPGTASGKRRKTWTVRLLASIRGSHLSAEGVRCGDVQALREIRFIHRMRKIVKGKADASKID